MNKRVFNRLILLALICDASAVWEFTNIDCKTLDKNFSEFQYCFLKSANRTYKFMSLRVILHKIPITKVTLNWTFLKKESGYKPFLYNVTFDACKFLKTLKNPFVRYCYDFFAPYSNMNHSCPFDHDLLVEKLPISHLDTMMSNSLPFPHGQYMMHTTWFAYGVPRAVVKIFIAFK